MGLAPGAARSATATRQFPVEDDGRAFGYRSAFQRDRDRIVYSRAFRRLRQKAVAGILPAYEDHRRNRLTHTLEVAQLARTIGRALCLNEDLIEAVALGHDLGQPPFGPAGSGALDELLRGARDGHGGPGLGDCGGFDPAWQALRVVDRLEKRYDRAGLNLTDATREGIAKSGGRRTPPRGEVSGVRAGAPPRLEGQVVALTDRVSTALSDLDDALQSGVVDPPRVERLQAVRLLKEKLGSRFPARGGKFIKANVIHRGLTHLMVTGIVVTSGRHLSRWAATHGIGDASGSTEPSADTLAGDEIRLGPKTTTLLVDLEGFLESAARRGYEADRVDGRGRRVILGLFAAYHADPVLLEDHVLLRFKERSGRRFLRDLPRDEREQEIVAHYRREPGFVRLLADHLAGMTDGYALREHARLMEMGAVPIPSGEQLRRER